MIDTLVAISLWSFWISFIGLSILLLSMRIVKVIYDRQSLKASLFIILLPCSIGLYTKYRDKTHFKQVYEIFVIIQFALMLIGSFMIFYIHFA